MARKKLALSRKRIAAQAVEPTSRQFGESGRRINTTAPISFEADAGTGYGDGDSSGEGFIDGEGLEEGVGDKWGGGHSRYDTSIGDSDADGLGYSGEWDFTGNGSTVALDSECLLALVPADAVILFCEKGNPEEIWNHALAYSRAKTQEEKDSIIGLLELNTIE